MPLINPLQSNLNRQKLQKIVPRGIALVVLLILYICLAMALVANSKSANFRSIPFSSLTDSTVGELVDGTVVKQVIQSGEPISSVQVRMATYARENEGDIRLVVRDLNNNRVLVDRLIPANRLVDNEYIELDFSGDLVAHNIEISITASGAIPGKAATIWKSSTDQGANILTINGEALQGELDCVRIVQTPKNIRGVVLHRLMLSGILFAFMGLHFVFGYRKIYDFIFKYRVFVALGITGFCVINGYHFSSIGMFDQYVEPGMGTAYIEPIFGKLRSIRSDEWLVSTPQMLSGQYTDYLGPNHILQAKASHLLSSSGTFFGFSGFALPRMWVMYFLPVTFGTSFFFCSGLIMAFFFSFELCYILTRKTNRAIALVGASFIILSTYYMWWSFATYLFSAQAAVVLFYYLIHAKQPISRAFFGFWTAIFGSYFVIQFYPAWQVPVGYVFLCILLYFLFEARSKFKEYKKVDILIFMGLFIFLVTVIGAFLYDSREYITAITNTVYPGKRVVSGGASLHKLFNYVPALFFAFIETQNPSEASIMINFFPLPIILNIYYMIRTKKVNPLATALILISIIFSLYCSFPLPEILTKVLLFSFSTPNRMVDIIALVQVILLVIALTQYDPEQRIKVVPAVILTTPVMILTGYFAAKDYKQLIGLPNIIIVCAVLGILVVLLMSIKKPIITHMTTASIFLICAVTSLTILPISKSLDVVYSKPISIKIQAIVETDPDAKWLSLNSLVDSGFLVANGAPTINSVQVIPNFDLWELLDSSGEYEEIYNRYAHLFVEISAEKTRPELRQDDLIVLKLNPSDLEKTGAQYILSPTPVSDSESYKLTQLYAANGHFIYRIQYN